MDKKRNNDRHSLPLWIVGTTRSGKTTHLAREFGGWVKQQQLKQRGPLLVPAILIFTANEDNRKSLDDRLIREVQGSYPTISKTPLGFMANEVQLFWPLLFQKLNLRAQFPLRLRPETEQELATQLWHPLLEQSNLGQLGVMEYRFVRQTLDLLQLAGASGTSEEIASILARGLDGNDWDSKPEIIELRGQLLSQWRKWCLERGLLTYGLISELYWQYLLPDETYRNLLKQKYQAVFADDTDDYPAIARDLLDFLLDSGLWGVFTYNPDSQVRLGLNADPNYLAGLAARCEVIELVGKTGLAVELGETVVELTHESFVNIPNYTMLFSETASLQVIQTMARSDLLNQTAKVIVAAIKRGEIRPEEIAIIAPGVDAIARYTLIELLAQHGIAVEPLNEQRPLISSPLVRSLLTLLAFIYPGLGHLIEREGVAEMLVVLSRRWVEEEGEKLVSEIDPVRAGLLADYCYHFDLESPHLKPATTYARWDRLGPWAVNAYEGIRRWLEDSQKLQQQHNPSVSAFFHKAMKDFLWNGSHLAYIELSALQELMETTQHYWEVDRRLGQSEPRHRSTVATVASFIELLRKGTIAANAYPLRPLDRLNQGTVMLANIFQYRSLRRGHRWHFWLDVGSNYWIMGGASQLLGSPLFLRSWSGEMWQPEHQLENDRQRLDRILKDLLGRADERVYLCHSDLAVNGLEQTGPLLPLIQAIAISPPTSPESKLL